MKKSEKDLKKNCILISEFRKCGFQVSNITYYYKSATYVGLFKYQYKFLVFSRVLTNELYEYDNWKDAYTHFTNLINDVK